MEATRLQLLQAGEPGGLSPIDWYGVRLLVSLAVAIVTFLFVMPQSGFQRALLYALIAGLVGFPADGALAAARRSTGEGTGSSGRCPTAWTC